MDIFPKSHEKFMAWSSAIASSLSKNTKGQCRIGHNKLAAIMARSLPGVGESFNINTLKSVLDESNSLLDISIEKTSGANESSEILACLKIDISHAVYRWMEQIVYMLAFDSINIDGAITEFYSDFNDINDETFIIANAYFSEHETQLLDNAYSTWALASEPFSVIQKKTVGYAYRKYLLDATYSFFNGLALYYRQFSASKIFKKLNKEQLTQWVDLSFKLWGDEEGVCIPKNALCFSKAMERVLGPEQYEYDVVVRAVVSGSENMFNEWELPSPWESYDFSESDSGDDSVLCADCIVNVTASNKADAIEKAKASAPSLNLTMTSSSVKLWVDSELDDDVKQGDMQPRF